jgi:hypothetical protein
VQRAKSFELRLCFDSFGEHCHAKVTIGI